MYICNQHGFHVQYTMTDKVIRQLLLFLLLFSTWQKPLGWDPAGPDSSSWFPLPGSMLWWLIFEEEERRLTLPRWEYVREGSSDRKENQRAPPLTSKWVETEWLQNARSVSAHQSCQVPQSEEHDKAWGWWADTPSVGLSSQSQTRNASPLLNQLDIRLLSSEFKCPASLTTTKTRSEI